MAHQCRISYRMDKLGQSKPMGAHLEIYASPTFRGCKIAFFISMAYKWMCLNFSCLNNRFSNRFKHFINQIVGYISLRKKVSCANRHADLGAWSGREWEGNLRDYQWLDFYSRYASVLPLMTPLKNYSCHIKWNIALNRLQL